MLTASQIDAMEAGSTLDAVVDETLMGSCSHTEVETINYQGTYGWVCVVRCSRCGAVPPFRQTELHYSTDLNAAYKVEERINELRLTKAYSRILSDAVATDTAGYFASRYSEEEELFLVAHASPEVRCKAALKALVSEGRTVSGRGPN